MMLQLASMGEHADSPPYASCYSSTLPHGAATCPCLSAAHIAQIFADTSRQTPLAAEPLDACVCADEWTTLDQGCTETQYGCASPACDGDDSPWCVPANNTRCATARLDSSGYWFYCGRTEENIDQGSNGEPSSGEGSSGERRSGEGSSGEVVCMDTDNGATDKDGDGCSSYTHNPSFCTGGTYSYEGNVGAFDDDDFTSSAMCCVCSGGTFGIGSDVGPRQSPSPPAEPPGGDISFLNFDHALPTSGYGAGCAAHDLGLAPSCDAICSLEIQKQCTDTDNGATDKDEDGCSSYTDNPSWCSGGSYSYEGNVGAFDDVDFTSSAMCCVCGGGTFGIGSGNSPDLRDAELPDWCSQRWCYVDPVTCSDASKPLQTDYFAPAKLFYSYDTCGGINLYAIPPPSPPAPPAPPTTPLDACVCADEWTTTDQGCTETQYGCASPACDGDDSPWCVPVNGTRCATARLDSSGYWFYCLPKEGPALDVTLLIAAVAVPGLLTVVMLALLAMLFSYRKKARRAQRLLLRRTDSPPVLPKLPPDGFHLFLSHCWITGQDQIGVIKLRLAQCLKAVKVFRDVDDLKDISQLEGHVRNSQMLLIFLSQGYFLSRNCLRELREASRGEKPLVLVHEHDPSKGGATLDAHQSECPTDIRARIWPPAADPWPFVRWHRLAVLQLVSIKEIAMALLTHGVKAADAALYAPNCITEASISLQRPVLLYVSESNTGAKRIANLMVRVAASKTRRIKPVDLTAEARPDPLAEPSLLVAQGSLKNLSCTGVRLCQDLRAATHMLLYLNSDTWASASDDEPEIAKEVRRARSLGTHILLVHERDPDAGACTFERFLYLTPDDLVQGGLYNDMAVALFPSQAERAVALAQLFERLSTTACDTSSNRRQLRRADTKSKADVPVKLTRQNTLSAAAAADRRQLRRGSADTKSKADVPVKLTKQNTLSAAAAAAAFTETSGGVRRPSS